MMTLKEAVRDLKEWYNKKKRRANGLDVLIDIYLAQDELKNRVSELSYLGRRYYSLVGKELVKDEDPLRLIVRPEIELKYMVKAYKLAKELDKKPLAVRFYNVVRYQLGGRQHDDSRLSPLEEGIRKQT